jgi:tryptophanyl-tRNA synthetase
MSDRKRILTGHRTTGPRHIGHLVGTLNKYVELQSKFDCYFLIADLHALTTDFVHPEKLRENTLNVIADFLAAGIDPKRANLVLQSAIPEHARLCLLLSMLTSVSRLERNPTYKDQVHELKLQPTLGFLTYPVLQAADILLYKAGFVPVGEDQLPHLELAREIARRFNQLYGETFPEPEALLSSSPRLPGIDNRSMHTSYGNAIYLRDTPEETSRKVMNMYTDPTRIHANDPGHVEGNPVFTYLEVFDRDSIRLSDLEERYRAGRVGDMEVKYHLVQVLNNALQPIRARRAKLMAHPEDLLEILQTGTERARSIARETYQTAAQNMGFSIQI